MRAARGLLQPRLLILLLLLLLLLLGWRRRRLRQLLRRRLLGLLFLLPLLLFTFLLLCLLLLLLFLPLFITQPRVSPAVFLIRISCCRPPPAGARPSPPPAAAARAGAAPARRRSSRRGRVRAHARARRCPKPLQDRAPRLCDWLLLLLLLLLRRRRRRLALPRLRLLLALLRLAPRPFRRRRTLRAVQREHNALPLGAAQLWCRLLSILAAGVVHRLAAVVFAPFVPPLSLLLPFADVLLALIPWLAPLFLAIFPLQPRACC